MMPLTMLNRGESASIVRVGGNEETKDSWRISDS